MPILMMMNDYIINANTIYISLNENLSTFENEAIIIDELKCHLINFKNLDEFDYPGCYVYEVGNGYEINYNGLCFHIETEDGMITDFSY